LGGRRRSGRSRAAHRLGKGREMEVAAVRRKEGGGAWEKRGWQL